MKTFISILLTLVIYCIISAFSSSLASTIAAEISVNISYDPEDFKGTVAKGREFVEKYGPSIEYSITSILFIIAALALYYFYKEKVSSYMELDGLKFLIYCALGSTALRIISNLYFGDPTTLKVITILLFLLLNLILIWGIIYRAMEQE